MVLSKLFKEEREGETFPFALKNLYYGINSGKNGKEMGKKISSRIDFRLVLLAGQCWSLRTLGISVCVCVGWCIVEKKNGFRVKSKGINLCFTFLHITHLLFCTFSLYMYGAEC